MTLRQQIIEDRIEDTANVLGVTKKDVAFLRLAHSIVTGQSPHAFDASDLVDGGQDKQIDTITIEQDDEEGEIYIIQAKNSDSFSSNALIQMHNGLDWFFNKTKKDLQSLGNAKFRDRILEYRSVQSDLGASNLKMTVAFVTKGHTDALAPEFKQEAKAIIDEYDNGTFARFDLLVWGSDELVLQLNRAEKKNRKIDAKIKIRYDTNNPSLIKYHSHDLKGIVCSTTARELARIVNADPSGFVFDSNVRRFLGSRGAVNADIRETCTSKDNSHLFWFLNNGITIVCDSFDPNTDPDDPHIKIKNIQIVNGCQTAATLARAAQDKTLAPDVAVLLRIYEASDNTLVDQIVLTTNNQNRITGRDLRANDRVQIEMEERFRRYDLLYERKNRQYDNVNGVNATNIVPNELVAQSYLAVVLKRPSDARRRKYKVWGELYDKIFSGQIIEPFVVAFLLHRLATRWLQSSKHATSKDDVLRKAANNGAYHIARIAAFQWRGTDDWNSDEVAFKQQIEALQGSPITVNRMFEAAIQVFKKILRASPQYVKDLDRAMKSYTLDADINRTLHQSQKGRQVRRKRRAAALAKGA